MSLPLPHDLTATQLPYAWGGPLCDALIRQAPEDFEVEEVLGFEPEDSGEHLFVWVEKKGQNTDYVARQLALAAGIAPKHVAYSGLKDRHAVTRQWFSLHLPGQCWSAVEESGQVFTGDGFQVLQFNRHNKKLKRGVHRANRFRLRLNFISPLNDTLSQQLTQRWHQLCQQGAPNYFGPQRFGQQGRNLVLAARWLAQGAPQNKKQRHQQGLWLSAARSWLFNEVLAERVKQNNWNQLQVGDNLQLTGTRSRFPTSATLTPQALDELKDRMANLDLHPTGPLPGKGLSEVSDEAQMLETACLQDWSAWIDALEKAGAHHERRALRLRPEDGNLTLGQQTMHLTFMLPTGAFATTLIRELVNPIESRPI